MNQLVKQNISYSVVPKAAENEFYRSVIWWYESASYEGIPTLSNDMFYYDEHARDGGLLDFVTDVGYFYHSKTLSDFNPEEFPTKFPQYDFLIDGRHNFFLQAYDEFLERGMITDMRKWLDIKHLFYMDKFDRGSTEKPPKAHLINCPLKEIW